MGAIVYLTLALIYGPNDRIEMAVSTVGFYESCEI